MITVPCSNNTKGKIYLVALVMEVQLSRSELER